MNKKILFVICILFVIIFCMVNIFFVNSSYAKAVKRDDVSVQEGETREEIDPINNPSSFDPSLTAPTDINSSNYIRGNKKYKCCCCSYSINDNRI